MVIVQIGTKSQRSVEEIKTSYLKPYQENTRDFYVTAYLKAADRSPSFVIGDSKEYSSANKTYFNQPLTENTDYIVFLRFFESEVSITFKNEYCFRNSQIPQIKQGVS